MKFSQVGSWNLSKIVQLVWNVDVKWEVTHADCQAIHSSVIAVLQPTQAWAA